MLLNVSVCIFLFLSNVARSDEVVANLKKIVKRHEIDLQTCIENFDVHEDKIIRTQDSRDMGAKYLNELDIGSREECLRLCCETNSCDVFVFEEKSPGSCYLFHCGPPEDFKCKFTRHVNYTSAVLAISRHNELENQIKMTKHEQDLTRLRKPEELGALAKAANDAAQQHIPPVQVVHTTLRPLETSTQRDQVPPLAPVAAAAVSKELLPDTVPKHSGRACSRYQFECRSTSECIAIYNACDGIPQCADGSDEAPELGCPATANPSTNTPPLAPPAVSLQQRPVADDTALKSKLNFQNFDSALIPKFPQLSPKVQDVPKEGFETRNMQPMIQITNGGVANSQNYNRVPPQLDSAQIPPPQALPVTSYNNGVNNNPQIGIQPGFPYQSQTWIPHQSNQMSPMASLQQNQLQYSDQGSHIFNHKMSGLQVADPAERYNKMQEYIHRTPSLFQNVDIPPHRAGIQGYNDGSQHDFPKFSNYYNNEAYRPQIPDAWQNMQRVQDSGNSRYIMPPDIRENWQQASPINNHQGQVLPPYGSDQDLPLNWKPQNIEKSVIKQENLPPLEKQLSEKNTQQESLTESEKIISDVKHIEKKNNKTETHETHHKHKPVASELKMSEEITIVDIKDDEIDKPSGAILSLTLGMFITSILIVIIGCRLRVVRKRMRRGGKSPYAHDADYLVNGMYL